ncbi:hypothetical protein CCAX7_65820 [Capsulimonas corticalis]|uniref:Uncharacterized protein n=1 Tax=Capsulimonas corticalis TaxID=2219043 RepID=A0A402CR55_9BACT|nr:ATP-grasp domain-containing protein [Capsulimonas corticalis]BDI34531.1 hypothetical protein CCAX7_65820 [Capsulimonas corticalis]
MHQTTWILQDIPYNPSPSIVTLERVVLEAGYRLVKTPVVPFSDRMPDIPDDIPLPIVIYGMNTMIQTTSRHPKWRHGLFFEPEKFEPAAYTQALGDRMLNSDAQLLTCEELAESGLSPTEKFFLRPNDDSKTFTGQVMDFREFWRWYHQEPGDEEYVDLHPDMRVLYSTPKTIKAEYRTFILDRKVIALTQYLPEARLLASPEVIEFAEDIAARYAPSEAFVCDIAATNEGWKVIEFNCINGSGFYLANVDAIVRSLSAWQEHRVTEA